jgi:hypothetical protein
MTATAPESLDERWTALEAHRARLVQLGVRRLGSRPDAEDCASEARRFVHAIARLCVCSCVFFGTGLVSAEATAAASQAQRLGAVNQFDAGSAEVTTLVDIPRTATLAGTFCELPQEDRITGTAAVVLVTLIRVPYNTYDAIHYNAVFSFGRYTTPTGRRLAFDTACSADRTLIAGTYRVTVQHSAGRHRGLRVDRLGIASPAGAWTDCMITPGSRQLPAEVAYSPACPPGEATTLDWQGTAGGQAYFSGGLYNGQAGEYGVGMSYQVVGDAHPEGELVSFLPFNG